MRHLKIESKDKIAVCALSADPITYGHINIVERAAACFDQVIVSIGVNPAKHYLFDAETRVALAEKSLKHIANVSVQVFSGLLVDFAFEQNATVIVKGVRNTADFDYESTLHQVGESQHLGIDTHLLFAEQQYAHISSSSVKGLQFEQGFIQELVPLPIKVALEAKLSNQAIVGVTGSIASGKSTLCEALVSYGKEKNLSIHNIDMDKLAHELLADDPAPYAKSLRKEVIERFGADIVEGDNISRDKLGNKVFGNPEALMALNLIMYKPLLLKLRRAIYRKEGLILLNATLLAEASMLKLCNNRVILMQVDECNQMERLIHRGHSEHHAKARLSSQMEHGRKAKIIEGEIERSSFGKLWKVSSNEALNAASIIEMLEREIGELI